MLGYKYLIPNVTIAPPKGFAITDFYPIHHLANTLAQPDSDVSLCWSLYKDGECTYQREVKLSFRGYECVNPEEAVFRYQEDNDDCWVSGASIGYLETRAKIDDNGWFCRRSILQNYTAYSGRNRKSFISPQAFMFSNPQIIEQVRSYGVWVEGYPAAHIDRKADIDLSIVLINPYERPSLASLQFPTIGLEKRIKVMPHASRRVSLADCLPEDRDSWRGQFYVSGPTRVVCFMVHHSGHDPFQVTKLEHLDPYRGETAWVPFTRALYEYRALRRDET